MLLGAVALSPSPCCCLSAGGGILDRQYIMLCSSCCAPQPGHPPQHNCPSARGPERPGLGSALASFPRPPARWRGWLGCPRYGSRSSRTSPGLWRRTWSAGPGRRAGGPAGPPRWLCPLEGKRAPHKRDGAAAPAPQHPPRPAPLLPRSCHRGFPAPREPPPRSR